MAIVFPNGTQSGAVINIRQSVYNGILNPSFNANTWTSIGFEASITPASASNKVRMTWALPAAAPGSYNSSMRIARSIGGGAWGEVDSTCRSTWGNSRPAGHYGSFWWLGNNWSTSINISIVMIDSPATTSSVAYRPEIISESNGNLFFGYNYDQSQTSNAYHKAPLFCILEEIDNSILSSTDANAS